MFVFEQFQKTIHNRTRHKIIVHKLSILIYRDLLLNMILLNSCLRLF